MNRFFRRLGVSALVLTVFWQNVPPASAGKHFEKSPAARQRKAEHRAKKAEKQMAAKKRLFSHG